MSTWNTQLAYQEAAVRNAGPVDLIIILYDILVRDLQKAIAAMEAGQIELRTRHIKHGLLALQQLEGTLDREKGGDLTASMLRFYSVMRAQMVKAQAQQDPAVLRESIRLLFTVREAWVEMKAKLASSAPEPARPSRPSAYDEVEVRSSSWNS